MSNRSKFPVKAINPAVVEMDGYVSVNSSGTVTGYDIAGCNITAPTWASSTLTVTFDGKWVAPLSCVVSMQPASATNFDNVLHIISFDPSVAGTVTLKLYDISAAGYTANPQQNVTFYFAIKVNNSDVTF